ncbi:MAG TPA: glycine--tRNA ligase subunit beta [Acidobacteriaceae bacterium]|nr:glycine--tRNA ligase subunit beta [Acidobacteriaceae bacterium]
MADFLFEIGLEEIPARMIAPAEAELAKRVLGLLERERLVISPTVKTYSTPRRIAVLVSGVTAKQEDVTEELVGPSAKIAFKDGVPTPAAEAFAKKSGVATSELKTILTPKGEYIAVTVKRAGRTAADVLTSELPKEIAGIYWAKNMYWREGKPERFVRPLRWMVALLDGKVVPVEFAGLTAGDVSYGHRILHGVKPAKISKPSEYASVLKKAFVVADVAERRETIRKALDAATRAVAGARWREDEELVETVTHLTEWPSVILGSFEPEYLTLPEEVLVTVMRDHQKYFAVEDASGKLAPHFLAVLNTQADTAGQEVIRHGNARVLRARFNDARFFWDYDQKILLKDRVEMLKTVTFQKDLGSYYAKSEKVRALVVSYATMIPQTFEVNAALDAAVFAKTDLTTELVKEFTELQGIVGGLYARAQGLNEKTAAAIYAQYQPAGMEDLIPPTVEGQILGIADRANTIVDMFAIGLAPTGSKDPFALRRAANGVVKILAEGNVALTLEQIIGPASGHGLEKSPAHDAVMAFFAERVEFYLREVKQQAYDVVKAVLAGGADDVRDAVARAEAVTAVRGSDDFAAISAAFKRMKNILTQAAEKDDVPEGNVDAALLTDAAEIALAKEAKALATKVETLRQEKKYAEALQASATLRKPVDAFFEAVMVMAPDAAVRANRLALLQQVLGDFSKIADFSEIVTAG